MLCLALALCLCQAACTPQGITPTTGSTTLPTTEEATEATTQATEPANYSVLESAEPIENIILMAEILSVGQEE